MTSHELDQVERPALQQLQSLGWLYVEGAPLSPHASGERTSFKEVVLEKRLTASIKRINPWINDENLHKVVRELTKTPYSNLIEANQAIWTSINECVSVMQDRGKGNKGQTVHIIDFKNPENNEFLCTNQFKVSGVHQDIIPDIVLFMNGLPLAVIECKSPVATDPMEEGITQLLRYANRRSPSDDEGAERLFYYNLMMVSTHQDKARVGTITSRMEHFLEWKDPYPLTVKEVRASQYIAASDVHVVAYDTIDSGEMAADPSGSYAPDGTADDTTDDAADGTSSQEVLIAGLFSKANFLDILQNFTVFETVDSRIIKKMPRYQQFRAVHKAIERIKTGKTRKDKSGVVWHTQGSGKSLTMVFLTIKMRRDPQLRGYKLVFVTDRTQLDNQLTSTFTNTQGETIHHAHSVKELKKLLVKDSSDIVACMVQKFRYSEYAVPFPALNESEKIIILIDEAHRTQYGKLGAAINTALPNAPRIAFTGTPLIKSQKTTDTFGTYIDTYTIEQAVKDGATIQILYEGREPAVKVTGDSLDSLFDVFLEDYTDDEKAAIKQKCGTKQAILEAPQRIRRICMDIVKHYREHIQPNGFKAMVVTSSRNAAILYKKQLDKLNAPQSAVVISHGQNDEKRFLEYTDGTEHKQQIQDFKRPLGVDEGQSNLSILIVNKMLLTGFDAPIAQVMYLDRRLSEHSLLQAIARVNRTNKNKFRGYIVDYYGLSDYLSEALEMFSSDEIQGALPELKEEIPKLENAHTRVLQHFKEVGLADIEGCVLSLENEVKRKVFQKDFSTFSRQLDIVLPDPAATPFLSDLRKLGEIAVRARNIYRDEQLNITGVSAKVRELIEEHVYSTGIDLKIPPVDLLASDYKERLNQHKSPRTKASEIEQAIKHHIKIHLAEDPEYYKKLSERLKDIIRKHEERWEDLTQILLGMRDTMEEDHQKQAHDLGLSTTELSFYNILVKELSGEKTTDTDKSKAKDVVQSLVRMLDEVTQIVDFFAKQDERRRVIRSIKRLVIDRFDESLVNSVTTQFMELAEMRFK